MNWQRDIRQDTASIDREGTGTAQRGYLLGSGAAIDPTAICINPQLFFGGESGLEPLPTRGSDHPVYPSLKLDVYTSQCDGATHRITAHYSNDGRFVFPPPGDDPDRLIEIHYSSAVEEVKVPYPFARRVEQKETLPAGYTGPTARVMLKYGEKHLNELQRRWSWEVIISESELDEAELAMDNQHNRLHFIRSRYWRFQAAPVQFYKKVGGEKKYRIEYTWIGDRGSNDPTTEPINSDGEVPDADPNQPRILPNRGPTANYWEVYFPPQSMPEGIATYPLPMTRQPFCTFTVGKERIQAGEPMPRFIQFLPYIRDDFGWQSLKGL